MKEWKGEYLKTGKGDDAVRWGRGKLHSQETVEEKEGVREG